MLDLFRDVLEEERRQKGSTSSNPVIVREQVGDRRLFSLFFDNRLAFPDLVRPRDSEM